LETNSVLRAGWDPERTPGFPLDGGVEQWELELRGTNLAKALQARRDAAAERP
jgi:hypothetical protein